MSRNVAQSLAMLRDCGVVRVRFDDDVLIQLVDTGLIVATPVDDDEDALDMRLADHIRNLPVGEQG